MKQIVGNTVLWFYTIGTKLLSEAEYNLVIVEEEAVPLAAGDMVAGKHLMPLARIMMGLVLVLTTILVYWSKCMQCRVRIRTLCNGTETSRTGWNLKRLRETVSELEWKMAGK